MLPHISQIAAVIPRYTPAGDATNVLTTDGASQLHNKKTESVLKELARIHAVDLKSLRRNSSRSTGCSLYQPLPITPQFVLLPVKMRKPKVTGDNCTGYLNYYAILSLTAVPGNPHFTRVELAGGALLDTLWSMKTLKKSVQSAKLAINDASLIASGQPSLQSLTVKLVDVITEILNIKLRS